MGGATILCALFLKPLTVIPLALWAFSLSFFRDPERTPPEGETNLVSPADGKVTDVDEVEAPPFLGGPEAKAIRVGIFLSVFNVHVNRAPVAGIVRHLEHKDGKYLDARNPASCRENERQDLGLELPGGCRVMIRQISGAIARRIVCKAKEGQGLARGERYGMIKFGSRAEVYAPAGRFQPRVKPGDVVKGGETLIGVMEGMKE